MAAISLRKLVSFSSRCVASSLLTGDSLVDAGVGFSRVTGAGVGAAADMASTNELPFYFAGYEAKRYGVETVAHKTAAVRLLWRIL